jgi:phosphopantothenoylcysteine decarboxylase/phosphopantothenate--cysteine ligase
MYAVVMDKFSLADVIIKTAAVADYRPEEAYEQKIKKGDALSVKLVRNPDILQELGSQKGDRFLVGFAAETENLLENAREKMTNKNLDLIVANDLTQEGVGFAKETNEVCLIFRDGRVEELPLMLKSELSHLILERVRAAIG